MKSIRKKFYGEQTPGTAVVLKVPRNGSNNSTPTSKTLLDSKDENSETNFKFVVWTAVHGYLQDDVSSPLATYNALRSAFIAILKHNKKHRLRSPDKCISKIACPVFYKEIDFVDIIAVERVNSFQSEVAAQIQQMAKAYATIAREQHPKIPQSIEKIKHRLRDLNPANKIELQANDKELEQLALSGALESRGFSNRSELAILISWVRLGENSPNPTLTLAASKALAGFIRNQRSEFTLKREDICKEILDIDRGCFKYFYQLAQSGVIEVHNTIPRSDLEIGPIIQRGAAGTVYKAKYKGQEVAVKVCDTELSEVPELLKEFRSELALLSLVQHPLLVQFYGASCKPGDYYIVTSLMRCNLHDVLKDPASHVFTAYIQLVIAKKIASILAFLHSLELVHRDLKSMNVLIGESLEDVVLCDFGLSRVVDREHAMTAQVGTMSWIAPEIFKNKKYTEKADIYSFGIVLWEILTRKLPFEEIPGFSVPLAVIKGDRPPIPKDLPPKLSKLLKACWSPKSNKRPSATAIVDTLDEMIQHIPKDSTRDRSFSVLARPSGLMERRDSSSSSPSSSSQFFASFDQEGECTAAKIPESLEDAHYHAQLKIDEKFGELSRDGHRIQLFGERYLLIRAKLLASDFPALLQKSSPDNSEESRDFVSCLMYDVSHSLGRDDARLFRNKFQIKDPMELYSFGNVMSSYMGWSFIEILESENSSFNSEDPCVLYRTQSNFESTIWQRELRKASMPVCCMNAGYISGWAEESFGCQMVSAEISCEIKSDEKCAFLLTRSDKIEHQLKKCEKNDVTNKSPKAPSFLEKKYLLGSEGTIKRRSTSPLSASGGWIQKAFSKSISRKISFAKIEKNTLEEMRKKIEKSMPAMTPDQICARAEEFFQKVLRDPSRGRIEIGTEPFVFLRAGFLAYDFYEIVRDLASSDKKINSKKIALSYLFNFAYALGASDMDFFTKKLCMGKHPFDYFYCMIAHMEETGWSTITTLPATCLSMNDGGFCIMLQVEDSFEVQAWKENKGESEENLSPVCTLCSGYMTGWCGQSFGVELVAVEVTCRACGDATCTFLLAEEPQITRITKKVLSTNNLIDRYPHLAFHAKK